MKPQTTIKPCYDENSPNPKELFDFKPIFDVETLENNVLVDVVGVVMSINLPKIVLCKDGNATVNHYIGSLFKNPKI